MSPGEGRTSTSVVYHAAVLAPLSDEVWIDVTGAQRAENAQRIVAFGTPRPALADLVRQAREADGTPVLGGGEPTLGSDLPDLVAAVSEAIGSQWVLATDGLALTQPGPLASLAQRGLTTLRVRLVSARPDAHDWFYGRPGATKAAVRALRTAAAAGITTQIEVPLIRPTVDHLAETLEVAARVSASAVLAVHYDPGRFPRDEQVTLTPRLGLLEQPLTDTAAAALRLGVTFAVADLPQCFLPEGVAACRVRQSRPTPATPCGPDCPGAPTCVGVPEVYRSLFGSSELPAGPPTDLAEDDFSGTSRQIRMRLVRHGEHATHLRVTAIDHPDAAALLREALRLGFARVEVAADLAPLAAFSDDELHRLRRLTALRPTGPVPPDLRERIGRIAPQVELGSTS